jgi:hypothetical protein
MISHPSTPRSLLLAGAFLSAFTLGAAAQQPAAAPPAAGAPAAAAPALPPGSPLIGRPAGNEAAAKLAPNAPPPIPAAPDKLPTAKLKVPAGFNIEVYAAGMANARSLAVGDKGTVFVGSRLVDKVYAIVNKDGKRESRCWPPASTVRTAARSRTARLHRRTVEGLKIERSRASGQPPKPTLICDKLPGTKPMAGSSSASDPTASSTFRSASPQQCAAQRRARPDPPHESRRLGRRGDRQGRSQHRRFRLESETKQLYFTDNGRDWMSEDVPEDELNRVTKVGEHSALLPAGQYRRSRNSAGQILQRVHRTGRPAGARIPPHRACASTPSMFEDVQERDHHGPARLLEQVEESWR